MSKRTKAQLEEELRALRRETESLKSRYGRRNTILTLETAPLSHTRLMKLSDVARHRLATQLGLFADDIAEQAFLGAPSARQCELLGPKLRERHPDWHEKNATTYDRDRLEDVALLLREEVASQAEEVDSLKKQLEDSTRAFQDVRREEERLRGELDQSCQDLEETVAEVARLKTLLLAEQRKYQETRRAAAEMSRTVHALVILAELAETPAQKGTEVELPK
jgi:hypothetical protein